MKTYQAGESTRKLARQRRGKQIEIVLLMVIVGIGVVGISHYLLSWTGSTIVGILVLFVGRIALDHLDHRADNEKAKEKRAIRGARAEETIGTLLTQLGKQYLVMHDVRSPYGNIDHVVLSDHGIFIIETKAHGGHIRTTNNHLLLNNKPLDKDFISQTLSNTYWIKKKIKESIGIDIWVTAILVFTNAYVEGETIKGVKIINKRYLLPSIQQGKPTPSTWDKRTQIEQAIR